MEGENRSEERVNGLKTARWITREQLDRVEELVNRYGGTAVTRPHTGDKPYGPTVYEVADEPLIVVNKVSKRTKDYVGWVFPSKKQAKMLQEAGIIDYSDLEGSEDA